MHINMLMSVSCVPRGAASLCPSDSVPSSVVFVLCFCTVSVVHSPHYIQHRSQLPPPFLPIPSFSPPTPHHQSSVLFFFIFIASYQKHISENKIS